MKRTKIFPSQRRIALGMIMIFSLIGVLLSASVSLLCGLIDLLIIGALIFYIEYGSIDETT